MPGGIRVPIATEYDGTGVHQAETDLDAFGRKVSSSLANASASSATHLGAIEAHADKSRLVFGRFAGSAVRDLASLSSSFGPLNSALDQVAAKSIEGHLTLAGLASVAGPMAALGLVVAGIKTTMDGIAASKAFSSATTARWVKDLQDGKTVAEAISGTVDTIGATIDKQRARERGSPGWLLHLPAGRTTKDVTDELLTLGLTTEKIAFLAQAGKPAIDAYTDALARNGANAGHVADAHNYLIAQEKALSVAMSDVNARNLLAAQTTLGLVGPTKTLNSAMGGLEAATAAAGRAAYLTGSDFHRLAMATEEATLASYEATNKFFATQRAQDKLTDATAASSKALGDYNRARDYARRHPHDPRAIAAASDAQDKLTRSITDQAEAASVLEGLTNDLSDAGLKQTVIVQTAIDRYDAMTKRLGPNDPLRKVLQGLSDQLRADFPADIYTRVHVIPDPGFMTPGGLNPRVPLPNTPLNPNVTSATSGPSTVIHITGAIDPVATAKQVRTVLNDDADRRGKPRPFGP